MKAARDMKKGKGDISKMKTEQRLHHVVMLLRGLFELFCQYGKYLWDQNPLMILVRRHQRLAFVQNYEEVMIQPRFGEKVLGILMSDYRRRQRLLDWVSKKVGTHSRVWDFCTCWQDGTVLCALLEAICPGVCPSYHLLSNLNRVKNCRLGLKLANKYLYVPLDLISPEEFAIATKTTELKVIQYVSMVKWASENIKDKWSALHESLIAAKTGRCFAKGTGLRSGIVDNRSKFTVLVSDTIGVFNLLVEVRGPNHEYCGERVVSLHQAKSIMDMSSEGQDPQSQGTKFLEDCAGNTFVRKKIPNHFDSTYSGENVNMDIQCGEEGTFYVTFVPKRAGMHTVAVKWQNHHVENSPFRIKVYKASNLSTKYMKGAAEKRVIYDSLSLSGESEANEAPGQPQSVAPADTGVKKNPNTLSVNQKAYSKGRQLTVTRRRVLRRIITRNGEDIVIEESISPSLSRQSSFNDISDDDNRAAHANRHGKNETIEVKSCDHQPDKQVNLSALPEEKQASDTRPSDGVTSLFSKQTTNLHQPTVKSHDVNEDGGVTSNGNIDSDGSSRSQKRVKRAPLQRFSTIHPYQKRISKRTKSEDPNCNSLSSINQKTEVSDDSSEVSSAGGTHAHAVKEKGEGHSLKVLHSGSMKKACMYMSEKALTHTMSSLENQSITDEIIPLSSCKEFRVPEKRPLRETKSLPIMRKFWGHENDSVVHQYLDDHPDTNLYIMRRDHSAYIPQRYTERMTELGLLPGTGFRHGDEVDEVIVTHAHSSQRAELTRQSSVSSKPRNGSVSDSEPNRRHVKKDKSPGLEDIESDSKNKNKRNSVTVVTPRPKADKATQAVDQEIVRETNWELYEGIYLLFRRISFKVPYQVTKGTSLSSLETKDQCSVAKPRNNTMPSEQGVDSLHVSEPLNVRMPSASEKGIERETEDADDDMHKEEQNDEHDNVNAWLLRHQQLLERPDVPFHRQATRETEDSGFDDNLGNYSRHGGRLSLPSVLLGNGHVKLHRRPYRGPYMALDPRLVNSNSSTSMSVDCQERGNEADDEQPLLYVVSANSRQQRRRHRRINREDSFSLSDSEIHERRKRIKRRAAFCYSNSRADESLPMSLETHRKQLREALFGARPFFQVPSFRRYPTLATPKVSMDKSDTNDQQTTSGAVEISKPNPPVLKNLTSTSESVESNYRGFGISKPNRNELLSHIDAFQNLCPTEEESPDDILSQQPKIIHWHDENEVISCSDTNVLSNESAVDTPDEADDKNDQTNILFSIQDKIRSNRNSNPRNRCSGSDNDAFTNESPVDTQDEADDPTDQMNILSYIENNIPSSQNSPVRKRLGGTSEFYDIHSTSNNSCGDECLGNDDDDSTFDSLVRYGDVVSVDSEGNHRMIVRMAGAGLRNGTVGSNNAFQVWVEHPLPGSLTVNVEGPGNHTVTETSVLFTGDNLYEVSFRVSQRGQYKIFVKWADRNVTKVPYICDIT